MTSKPITFYTAPTPNGVVVSIFLEELKVRVTVEVESPSLSSTSRQLMVDPTMSTLSVRSFVDGVLKFYPSVVKMSIRDADIGKVHNQVKSPWFLKVRIH
jgi:glutathione S-transferase